MHIPQVQMLAFPHPIPKPLYAPLSLRIKFDHTDTFTIYPMLFELFPLTSIHIARQVVS